MIYTALADLPAPRFNFDQIAVHSDQPYRRLRSLKRTRRLQERCPTFRILPARQNTVGYRSVILFVPPDDRVFWSKLARYSAVLGSYAVTSCEPAFDFASENEQQAVEHTLGIARCVRKLWHSRSRVVVQTPDCRDKPTPPDRIPGPSAYFESDKARTGLVVYSRYRKTRDGWDPEQPLARLEFVLHGSRNVTRKTGIRTLDDLASFDPAEFQRRWLRFEEPDKERLSAWLGQPFDQWVQREAEKLHLAPQTRLTEKWRDEFELCLFVASCSASVRAAFRTERRRLRKKPGRRTRQEERIEQLTRYRVERFFRPLTAPGAQSLMGCQLNPPPASQSSQRSATI